MKRFALAILGLALLLPFNLQAQKGSHSSSSRSSSHPSSRSSSTSKSSTKSSGSGKTVHVKEHVRKDGTVVKAHDRSAPGTKSSSKSSPSVSSSGIPSRSTVAARDGHGRIQRSAAARKEFMKNTGYAKGRKGYIVDHVVPLECGGMDTPANMQWQTVQEAKIKDRTERNCRRE